MKEPVIRKAENTNGYRLIEVYGGLHMIRGNKAPYFSITGSFWREYNFNPHNPDECGCCHELIVKLWPELRPLTALHLSDHNGQPMYAVENGWYYLAADLPGHGGQQYYWNRSERAGMEVCADHLRIGMVEMEEIKRRVIEKAEWEGKERWKAGDDEVAGDIPMEDKTYRPSPLYHWKSGKMLFGDIVNGMRSRWKREADATIKEFGLVVYGDHWAG